MSRESMESPTPRRIAAQPRWPSAWGPGTTDSRSAQPTDQHLLHACIPFVVDRDSVWGTAKELVPAAVGHPGVADQEARDLLEQLLLPIAAGGIVVAIDDRAGVFGQIVELAGVIGVEVERWTPSTGTRTLRRASARNLAKAMAASTSATSGPWNRSQACSTTRRSSKCFASSATATRSPPASIPAKWPTASPRCPPSKRTHSGCWRSIAGTGPSRT